MVLKLIRNNLPNFGTIIILALSIVILVTGIITFNKANSINLKQYQIFGGSTNFQYDGEVIIKVDGNNLIIGFPDMKKEGGDATK